MEQIFFLNEINFFLNSCLTFFRSIFRPAMPNFVDWKKNVKLWGQIYQARTPKRNEICFQTLHRSKLLTHCLKTDVLNVSVSSVCAVHFDKFRPWLNIRTSEACPRRDTEAFLHTLFSIPLSLRFMENSAFQMTI